MAGVGAGCGALNVMLDVFRCCISKCKCVRFKRNDGFEYVKSLRSRVYSRLMTAVELFFEYKDAVGRCQYALALATCQNR